MKIKEITDAIERFAPLALQEEYDNAGLVVGDPEREVGRALLAVDVTEEVLAEAEQEGCDLVVTHHPIVFHPLKRLNETDYVQRCVARAVRWDIPQRPLFNHTKLIDIFNQRNVFCTILSGCYCIGHHDCLICLFSKTR